jgi:8-oxo-dGTP pyrophosphatase MutT (NUDIX family)
MIVVRPNQKSILLIYSADRDDWEFAKGKLEPHETTLMAARRELAEETGLKNIVIRPDWHHSIRYRFSLPKIGLVYKTVKYYLATSRDRVKLSSEHQTYRWVTWSEARLLLRHRNYQNMLNKVAKTLNILIK